MTTCDRSPDAGSGHHVYKATGVTGGTGGRQLWSVAHVAPSLAAASTMITKEKSPMRELFFRDHEISGCGPPRGGHTARAVRPVGRAGPEGPFRPRREGHAQRFSPSWPPL